MMRVLVITFFLISLVSASGVASQNALAKDSLGFALKIGDCNWTESVPPRGSGWVKIRFKKHEQIQRSYCLPTRYREVVLTRSKSGSDFWAKADSLTESSLIGRWHVKFTLLGGSEKNLVIAVREKGVAAFELLDTGPDDKPVPTPQPATWSKTLDNVSISGEVELPLGTCCRETGTLIFKAKLLSNKSFPGKLVFVTNVDEEESPYKFRSTIGTFIATRLPND